MCKVHISLFLYEFFNHHFPRNWEHLFKIPGVCGVANNFQFELRFNPTLILSQSMIWQMESENRMAKFRVIMQTNKQKKG